MDVHSLMPDSTPEYMRDAWVGFIRWVCSEPEAIAAFIEETGETYVAPNSPMDRLIDETTGRDVEFARRFIKWANENLWGDPLADAET